MSASDLPALYALLNATTAALLLAGWGFVRKERKRAHIACMTAALVTSAAFLVSYLAYHAQVGSVRFTAQGWMRPLYFAILLSHTILAAINVPLVICTVAAAARGRYKRHRAWARWTLPVWLYVSVTGVLVYLFLYRWWPPA